MTDTLGGMQVGSVTPGGASRGWMDGLWFGLAAAGVWAAQYAVFFVIGQVLGDTPSLFGPATGVGNILGALGLIVLAFTARRRGSSAALVGIGVVVAAGNAWWVIQFLLSQPAV